jgi:GWxTD domain-containing protein
VPLEGLGFDTYRLVATATLGDARVEGSVVFGVEIESETSLAPFFRDALDILEYIAGESEVAALRMANPADRAARWAEFWKKRDPTPETDANEFKEEFFRRMRYADTEFAATGRGWRTDRGRIYIQHGEPDSIERDAMPRDGYPIEIWLYDRLGLRFVFLDRTGFGDYRQVEGPG